MTINDDNFNKNTLVEQLKQWITIMTLIKRKKNNVYNYKSS